MQKEIEKAQAEGFIVQSNIKAGKLKKFKVVKDKKRGIMARIQEKIDNQEHMDRVLSKDPVWELLEHQDIVSQLFHIHNHFEIVKKMQPKSLPQLAMVWAIIRPAKRHLIGKDWNTIETSVWQRPTDNQYFFKKAHAYAYAQAIILQMNLLA